MPAICPSRSKVPDVQVVGETTSGLCAACGGQTLHPRLLIADAQLPLVQSVKLTCPRCGWDATYFPYQFAREKDGRVWCQGAPRMRCRGFVTLGSS